ncbi:hypothetical protein ACJQ6B_001619 [Escherichia coli]
MINIYAVLATIFYSFSITTGIMIIFMSIKAKKFHNKNQIGDKEPQLQHAKEIRKLKYFSRILIILIVFMTSFFGCIISTLLNPHVLATHLCVI